MENKKRILVVEDEKNIAKVLVYSLMKDGYECDTAYDGETGLNKALEGNYDLILLDIMLPRMTGYEVCERIRYKSQVPIIFVTAREEEKDKVLGLETGADDYVTKPFSVPELLSRIRANIRRSAGTVLRGEQKADETILVGELEIHTAGSEVRKNGVPLELSEKEFDILVYLAQHLGQGCSREDILKNVWGYSNYYGDVRNVDVAISRLREKIEGDSQKPEYIMTKRGVGYYLARR